MELLEGAKYTTKQIQAFLNVSENVWYKNRDKLLLHLSKFYEYHIENDADDNRKIYYVVDNKLCEYEKPTKKVKEKIELREKVFNEEIDNVIEQDNLQTAKNVSRIIKDTDNVKQFLYKDGTVYEYTRLYMREGYGKNVGDIGTRGEIDRKVWCRFDPAHNRYIPLEQEDINTFFELFAQEQELNQEAVADYCSSLQLGEITQSEFDRQLGYLGYDAFLRAQRSFFEMTGYRPIKISVYVKKSKNDWR